MSTDAPRRVASAPDTRERILDASEALFAVHGLAGTAVRDIARAVGLTPASLYNHFAGKQAIYDAVLERGVGPLLTLMGELASRDHTPRDLDEMIGAIMDQLASRPHLPRGLVIREERVQGLGDSLRFGGHDVRARGIQDLGITTIRCDHDRQSMGRRFQRHDSERFPDRCVDATGDAAEQAVELIVVEISGKSNSLFQAE